MDSPDNGVKAVPPDMPAAMPTLSTPSGTTSQSSSPSTPTYSTKPIQMLTLSNLRNSPTLQNALANSDGKLINPKIKGITVLKRKTITPSSGSHVSPMAGCDKTVKTTSTKTISLLVSPVASSVGSGFPTSSQSDGSSNPREKTSTPDIPRPVHLVTKINKSDPRSNGSLPSYTQRTSLNQPTPVPVSLNAMPAPRPTSPVKTNACTSNMDEGQSSHKLQYDNQIMSKSGRVKMISDIYQLRHEVKSAGNQLMVINFFSMGQTVCQRIAPHIQRLSLNYPEVVFLQVDIDFTKMN